MKIFNDFDSISHDFKHGLVTIGCFDGVHVGHREILRLVAEQAKQAGEQSLVLTFKNHPQQFFKFSPDWTVLSALETKLKLIEECGIGAVVLINFDREFACLSPDDFIRKILVEKLSVHKIIVGYNFKFGYRRKGNIELLKGYGRKYDFQVESIPPVKVDDQIVSSTMIRKLIRDGNIGLAEKMLGRKWN